MLVNEEQDRLCVILVRSRNPLNIGAAARAMSNFGFLRLRLVRPYDLAFREARSAVDAGLVLSEAEEFDSVAEAIRDCTLVAGTTGGGQRHPLEPLPRLETEATRLQQHLRSGGKVALLFGSEKTGLSNEDMNHCDLLLRIPTRPEHSSMNLGQAVAVTLYELVRQSSAGAAVTIDHPPTPTAAERERLLSLLLSVALLSGYTHHGPEPSLEQKLRRLVRHLDLAQSELHEWLGLVRKLVWKLKSPPLTNSNDSKN